MARTPFNGIGKKNPSIHLERLPSLMVSDIIWHPMTLFGKKHDYETK